MTHKILRSTVDAGSQSATGVALLLCMDEEVHDQQYGTGPSVYSATNCYFEKVVTFARQGYGGMTITVRGVHLAQGPAGSLVPGAQEVLGPQARGCPTASSARSSTTSTRDAYSLLNAVKGDGIGHAELSDITGGRQAPPARGAWT